MPGVRLATYTLDLVSLEETQAINEDPRKRAAEVEQLVNGEGHDAGGQDIILHPRIPCDPQSLCHAQVGIGFGDILILAPIGAGGQHGRIPRRRVSICDKFQKSIIQPPRGGGAKKRRHRHCGSWQVLNKREDAEAERGRRLFHEKNLKGSGREPEHKSHQRCKGQARRADSHPDNAHFPACDWLPGIFLHVQFSRIRV